MTEPASTETKLGSDFKFQVGTGSPPTFADFCAVSDPGAIGETKSQIDVTTLCDEARTYRGGLADGASISLKCNFLQGDTTIRNLYAAYQANTVLPYRLLVDDTSPPEYFQFDAAITAWNLATPVGDKATITFTLKISGAVTWHFGVGH